jgi:hypothetical protein
VDEVRYALQLEAIEDLLSALLARDDACFAEDVQVLRGGGPAEPNCVDEIADAALSVNQCPNQRQATGVTESLENLIR